jgi:hypothetical protein
MNRGEVETVISGRVYSSPRQLIETVQNLIVAEGAGQETQQKLSSMMASCGDYEASVTIVGSPSEELDDGIVLLKIETLTDNAAPAISIEVNVDALRRALRPFEEPI